MSIITSSEILPSDWMAIQTLTTLHRQFPLPVSLIWVFRRDWASWERLGTWSSAEMKTLRIFAEGGVWPSFWRLLKDQAPLIPPPVAKTQCQARDSLDYCARLVMSHTECSLVAFSSLYIPYTTGREVRHDGWGCGQKFTWLQYSKAANLSFLLDLVRRPPCSACVYQNGWFEAFQLT